jgi:hypothetical protein
MAGQALRSVGTRQRGELRNRNFDLIKAPKVRHNNISGCEPWEKRWRQITSRGDSRDQRTNICRGMEQPIFKKADELFSNSNLQIWDGHPVKTRIGSLYLTPSPQQILRVAGRMVTKPQKMIVFALYLWQMYILMLKSGVCSWGQGAWNGCDLRSKWWHTPLGVKIDILPFSHPFPLSERGVLLCDLVNGIAHNFHKISCSECPVSQFLKNGDPVTGLQSRVE